MRKEIADLWKLTEPHVEGAGYELIELQFAREPEGWVLRVFIDSRTDAARLPIEMGTLKGFPNPPANQVSDLFQSAPVGHEACERVSRDLSAALDVANVIAHTYRLEVSSPGIDRPLRREKDFNRFAGQMAKIRTVDAVGGRRNFSGTIRGAHDGVVDIECDGQSYQVPVDAITRANLVPDWTAEFHRSAS